MDIAAIGKIIEKIALNYPLGPVVVVASLYLVYDGYRSSNGAQLFFAGAALLWSAFTLFTFVVH
jgi:hypothetical protein